MSKMKSFGVESSVLLVLLLANSPETVAQNPNAEEAIRLNQVGFYPNGPKTAVVESKVAGAFNLITAGREEIVYTDTLGGPRVHPYGNRKVHLADFSTFSQPGTYRLQIPGLGVSHPFKISEGVHGELAEALFKGFYYQRASTPLPPKFAGRWSRGAGHPDDSVRVHISAATDRRPAGTVIRTPGGWYDAGDYNKYIVNSGITMATLFSFYEDFPEYSRRLELQIPGKDNGIPDLLDETLWNLRWMLTMQDPHDGGVYHKVTSPHFSGMVEPEEDRSRRYVVQKSTAATLNFTAVMAQAARIFSDFEAQLPGLADSCLSAAKRAWRWAREHPDRIYSQAKHNRTFDPDITTGAYGDRNLRDEFAWAAAELYVTTKDEAYFQAVEIIPVEQSLLPSWQNVQPLGFYTLLRFKDDLTPAAGEELLKIVLLIMDYADKLVKAARHSAYRTVMGISEENFKWGSNAVAARQAIALIQAFRLTSESRYLDHALSNLDYLLGRNGTGYSFVTGYGDKTPRNLHHRPSAADRVDEPVPGLLVGGPNPNQEDPCTYPSDVPDLSYIDAPCSYASNEVAINWNAAVAYLAGALEELQYEAGYSK